MAKCVRVGVNDNVASVRLVIHFCRHRSRVDLNSDGDGHHDRILDWNVAFVIDFGLGVAIGRGSLAGSYGCGVFVVCSNHGDLSHGSAFRC